MAIYIRLKTSFWQHRKTMRLRAALGECALWLPPRLWSYAAENQPDGDFSKYSAGELALLVGYLGDAQGMLEALQQASFMDDMKLHDWEEHNGYHAVFADRARKAAAARWKDHTPSTPPQKRQERKGKEKSKHRLSNATSIPNGMPPAAAGAQTSDDRRLFAEVDEFIALWSAAYFKTNGEKYLLTGKKDKVAVRHLLQHSGKSQPDIMRVAEAAWKHNGFFSKSAASLSGFDSKFNEIRSELNDLHKKGGKNGDRPQKTPVNNIDANGQSW